MDTQRFDDWTRTLATAQSRRRAVGILLGGMLARIGIGNEPEAEAKGGKNKHKNKNKNKKGKKGGGGGKPKPDECNGASDCNTCQSCTGGKCVPDLKRNGEVCAQCATCLKGQCLADPALKGKPCFNGSCKHCNEDGTCGPPDSKNCAEGQICRPADGRCAPACLEDGSPCPVNHICIDDGIFGAPNSCCLVGNDPGQPTNFGCGRNGDGTFRECCSSLTERCCDDILGPRCINKASCCANEKPCGGKCCKEGEGCLNQQCVLLCKDGREKCKGVCCQENEICNIHQICEDPTVCPLESCSSAGLKCCPPNRDTNAAYCCNPTDTCTGTFPGCSPS
jgi:hypothetical protein